MTIQVFQGRLRQRFSTLTVITAVNPILLEGEVWIEKNATTGRSTGRRKVGDGQVSGNTITGTAFNDLPYEPGNGETGDVVGPATSVDGRAALFDGITGKLLRQSDAAPVLEGSTPTLAGLTITGTGPVIIPHIHGTIAGNFYVHVRNDSGGSLAAGTPVYVTGSVGDTDRVRVAAADPTNPAKMPAFGLLEATLANNGDGNAVVLGELRPFNTAAYTLGSQLYIGAGGTLVATPPTTGKVQAVGSVARVSATTGTVLVQIGASLGTAAATDATAYDPAGSASTAISSHVAAADAHPGYLTPAEANAAYDAIGSAATVATAANARLNLFRDARTFWVSKRTGASDSNNGTSPGEPFLTVGAAVAAANAFRVANPTEFAAIEIGPGTYVEAALPMRLRPNILVRSLKQRSVRIKPAAGQELNSFFAVDSGDMICDITFAGHQAVNTSETDSSVGTRAWAIQFNNLANGGLGPILTASPYIKDCLSLTAEDDAGEAGSTSTGDCGGGVEVDGSKVHPDSPIRSMVVYGFTQQNLGGPGCVVKNDGYAELVSFFGLFGTWHVQCETGGQATMSGGGCSEFGIYGLVADGYSPTAIFTGALRVEALAAATTVDVVSMTANRLGTSSRPAAGQLMLISGEKYVVQSSTPITSGGVVVADNDPTRAGYRVTFYSPDGIGLDANVAQGVTADFRLRSQISAGCHSANYVGSGTNYAALPWNGGIPNRANEAVERNYGRVFGAIVNDVGDFKIAGGTFAVDGTTGSVTINTDQFNLSGLNAIGPFSRNGGVSTVGVQLQEVSNDANLIASTGQADGNTAPTQLAVKTYLDTNYSKAFNFEQVTPSTTWTINHNLGYKPAIDLFSVGSQEIDGGVVHTSDNQTVVTFTVATAGFARLN